MEIYLIMDTFSDNTFMPTSVTTSSVFNLKSFPTSNRLLSFPPSHFIFSLKNLLSK